jgi:hypothetical protein
MDGPSGPEVSSAARVSRSWQNLRHRHRPQNFAEIAKLRNELRPCEAFYILLIMPCVEKPEEVAKVKAYLQALQDAIRKIGIRPRQIGRYPFDTMSLALVSKAFSISNATLTLLEAGFMEEAFGLSRSIVECALTLRYLTQDRSEINTRTIRYMRFAVAEKEYWMHYALQSSVDKPMEQRILDHAKEWGIEPNPLGASGHWSGMRRGFVWEVIRDDHPLDSPSSTESSKKSHHAVNYHAPSSYVHCSAPAVENFLPGEFTPFAVRESSGEFERPSQKTLFILISYLHSCVAYALFGMNLERPKIVNDLFSDVLASLMPFRRLHSD